jgi:2-phosphoglycerate kinase
VAYTTEIDEDESNIRLNSYIAYSKEFSNNTTLSYVGYFQPKIDRINDYIMSNALELKVYIYKKLNIKFKLFYDVDSLPAIGREKSDFTQVTSFSYEF